MSMHSSQAAYVISVNINTFGFFPLSWKICDSIIVSILHTDTSPANLMSNL